MLSSQSVVYFAQQREDAGLEPLVAAPTGPPEPGVDFVAPLIANPQNTAELVITSASSIFAQGLASGTEERFDWREHAELTRVEQQGHCGACWAIAAAGVLSDREAITSKKNPQLSGAEAIACAAPCKPACSSCAPQDGFSFAHTKGLISTAGQKDIKCFEIANLCSCEDIQKNAEKLPRVFAAEKSTTVSTVEQLKKEIAANGPVATVYRVHRDFIVGSDPRRGKSAFAETNGIYVHSSFQPSLYGSSKDQKKLSETIGFHAVVIVGWGTGEAEIYVNNQKKKTKLPYWIVRNSWGDKWGDNGYFKCAQATDAVNQTLGIDLPVSVNSKGVKQKYGGVSFVALKKSHGASIAAKDDCYSHWARVFRRSFNLFSIFIIAVVILCCALLLA